MTVTCVCASAVVRSWPEGSILVAESVMWKIALGLFNDCRSPKFQDEYYPQLPGDQMLVAEPEYWCLDRSQHLWNSDKQCWKNN